MPPTLRTKRLERAVACSRILAGVFAALLALPVSMAGCTPTSTPNSTASDSRASEEVADEREQSASPQAAEPPSASEKNAGLHFEDIPAERVIDVEELRALAENGGAQIIDIRTGRSFAAGHIEGARNIPAGKQVEIRIDEFGDGPIVLVDTKNERLAEVRQTLMDYGIDEERIAVAEGGMVAWERAGLPMTEKEVLGC